MTNGKRSLTAAFNELPMPLRLIIVIVGGALVGGVYRILKWYEGRNTATLAGGIIATFTGIGNVAFWIADVISTAMGKGICIMAE